MSAVFGGRLVCCTTYQCRELSAPESWPRCLGLCTRSTSIWLPPHGHLSLLYSQTTLLTVLTVSSGSRSRSICGYAWVYVCVYLCVCVIPRDKSRTNLVLYVRHPCMVKAHSVKSKSCADWLRYLLLVQKVKGYLRELLRSELTYLLT